MIEVILDLSEYDNMSYVLFHETWHVYVVFDIHLGFNCVLTLFNLVLTGI